MGTGGETPLQGFLLLLSKEEQTEDAQLNLPEEYLTLMLDIFKIGLVSKNCSAQFSGNSKNI